MTLSDAELAALESNAYRIGIFFRLETESVVRIWLGFGSIQPGVNVFDPEGAEYKGFGELSEIPDFNQLLNGAAERVEFVLSGVSGDVLAIASGNDAQQVKGKRTSVGFALMDANWQLLGSVHWCALYIADFLSISQQPSAPGEDPVRVISLSCGSRFTGRRRPSFSYFSDEDHVARHPGDRFCSLVSLYAHGFNKQWPTFP